MVHTYPLFVFLFPFYSIFTESPLFSVSLCHSLPARNMVFRVTKSICISLYHIILSDLRAFRDNAKRWHDT